MERKFSNLQMEDLMQDSYLGRSSVSTSMSVSGCGSGAASNRRGNSSVRFKQESHRRRRVIDDGNCASTQSSSQSKTVRRRKPKRFSDVLIRSIRVPFILLIILVLWGPMLLRKQNPDALSERHKRPAIFSSFSSASRHRRRLEPFRDDQQDHDDQNDNNIPNDQNQLTSQYQYPPNRHHKTKDNFRMEQPQTTDSYRDKDPAVLKALRAAKTDFRLPPRGQEENDDQLGGPNSLSEDERKELQVPIVARNHQEGLRKDGNPKPQFKEFHLEKEQEQRELLRMQQQRVQQQQQDLKRQRELQQQQQELQRQREQLLNERRELQEKERKQQQQQQRQQEEIKRKEEEIRRKEEEKRQQQEIQRRQQEQSKKKMASQQQRNEQPQPRLRPPDNSLPKTNDQSFAKQKYAKSSNPAVVPGVFVNRFANIWTPIEKSDTALFWHIPKDGGTTVANMLTHCFDLVTASNIGATEGHGQEQSLVVRTYNDKGRYVNVNTASVPGINHARDLGLAKSGLADIVILHRLHEGALIFDPTHRARVFCMFRHPVKRAISMFYYLQRARWEPTYDPSLASMSLLGYANSPKVEENWVTRYILHEYSGRLTKAHVETAKQIMRTKFIVGIMESFEESVERFEAYFKWERRTKTTNCQNRIMKEYAGSKKHPDPPADDPGFQRLQNLNWADMQLYNYAIQLFQEQKQLV